MAKTFKERLYEKLPGVRSTVDAPKDAKKEPFFKRIKTFLYEFRVEMKKVTWPNRKETVGTTVVVIISVLIIVLFLGLVDLGIGKVIQSFLNY
ncbi:MAG: preprotein translocase subunit SecE [Deltaproteobacteria bacterium]|nr:MAG: preprotein translocase subunit SecE [Deltaproteobacteria bacterium]